MARPSKLTDTLTEQLAAIFERGNVSIEDACALVGIAPSTYYDWMKTNLEFSETIKRSRAHAVDGYLQVIRNAAFDGAWQAAAWWLERVRPDQFGRRQTTEVITRDKFMETVAELEKQLDDTTTGTR